jgi:hypothetical protein
VIPSGRVVVVCVCTVRCTGTDNHPSESDHKIVLQQPTNIFENRLDIRNRRIDNTPWKDSHLLRFVQFEEIHPETTIFDIFALSEVQKQPFYQ